MMTFGSILYPEVLEQKISPHTVEMTLKIPENLSYFDGHFPDFPIVPGIVQLHWSIEFSKRIFKILGFFSQGTQLKFSQVMRPEEEVLLILDHNVEKRLIAYKYMKGEQILSSGRFQYLDNSEEGLS
jgi:3-hydroxymyristoyl/3-hydroxydecanoyl-(acyl carrier protein) dehydratase